MTIPESAAHVLAELIHDFCKSFVEKTMRGAKQILEKAQIDAEIGFKNYLYTSITRISKVKTILDRENPVLLENIYVEPTFIQNSVNFQEDHLDYIFENNRLLIVTGAAGCGKSLFLKSKFLKYAAGCKGKIPFFIELRNVDYAMQSFEELIAYELRGPLSQINIDQVRYGLKMGVFAIFVDGLDEVAPDYRGLFSKKLLDLSASYRSTRILCTSRPNDGFAGWNEFIEIGIAPLTQNQVESLIEKVPFNERIKSSFLKILNDKLFDTHKEFLSNPLLCSMMLLTFDEHKQIPEKMHLFYSAAYDALYSKHDRSKGIEYTRKFYSRLSSDKFRNAFSVLCALSYSKDKIAITSDEFRQFSADALCYEGCDCDVDEFAYDLRESTSLMIQDGIYFSFIHRSFQEYFVAVFIDHYHDVSVEMLLDKSVKRGDQIANLLFDMNRDAFESKYFMERISDALKTLNAIDIDQNPALALSLFFVQINVELKSGTVGFVSVHIDEHKRKEGPLFYILDLCQKKYGARISWPLAAFDWVTWAKETNVAKNIYDRSLWIDAPTDDMLKDTPVVETLKSIKSVITQVSESINRRKGGRIKFFS